jgi:hypothetical protein
MAVHGDSQAFLKLLAMDAPAAEFAWPVINARDSGALPKLHPPHR